jgi:hypothetical protein
VAVPSSTIAHPLHMSPYIINNISHLCTILSIKIKKQTHLFIEPEATWQEEFDHAITILKESLKDYDITRAKLVTSSTHRITRVCVTSPTFCHDILTIYVITQFVFTDLDLHHVQRELGDVLYQPCAQSN